MSMITDLPTKRIQAINPRPQTHDKHFSEFLPTRWQQKSSGIDMEQNFVTVTLCIMARIKQRSLCPELFF